MPRPPRIEAAGVLYHLTARGNAKQDIFLDDRDRRRFVNILGQTIDDHHWLCYAWCLMSNHYHLLIELQCCNLSHGAQWLNSCYSRYFNRRYRRVGHVFQGRFSGILIEKETHLLEVSRYIVLNPVRAKMVQRPERWPWSSYRATAGLAPRPPWLCADQILAIFGTALHQAFKRYVRFVLEGTNNDRVLNQPKDGLYMGSEKFIKRMKQAIEECESPGEVSKNNFQPARKPLDWYKRKTSSDKEAMALAYASGHYSQREIAAWFGVSAMTVSRAVRGPERGQT
jgi:REP element-mobilizing transposase RayT